jgi:hypothetical protein
MRRLGLVALGLLISGAVSTVAVPAASEAERRATDAALIWLGLIDNGRYVESWKDASGYFRGAITKKGWEVSLRVERDPLGKVLSRDVQATKEATSLPGAPDGHYVVIQLKTSFAAKASAIETVTFTEERDGTWRAAGYYIR